MLLVTDSSFSDRLARRHVVEAGTGIEGPVSSVVGQGV